VFFCRAIAKPFDKLCSIQHRALPAQTKKARQLFSVDVGSVSSCSSEAIAQQGFFREERIEFNAIKALHLLWKYSYVCFAAFARICFS
jgi:hypothetical protein